MTSEEKKEKKKEYDKIYYERNKQKRIDYDKEYSKTDAGIQSLKIRKWKNRGVKSDDFLSLYDYFLNCKNCEECGKEGITGNNKHLDHDHETGEFRKVVCCSCNLKRGFIDRKLI